jgi:hypothetical protein
MGAVSLAGQRASLLVKIVVAILQVATSSPEADHASIGGQFHQLKTSENVGACRAGDTRSHQCVVASCRLLDTKGYFESVK